MRKPKRRIRSPHPGVVLLKRTLPSGLVVWQARYVDPDSGKLKKPLLDSVGVPTHEARTQWAKKKSKAIAKRRMELETGAPQVESRQLETALSDYLEGAKHRLRKKTLTTYRLAADPFVEWCGRHGVSATSDITASKLAAFRDSLIARTKHTAKRGGKRGQVEASSRKRSPVSINRELRTMKTLLNTWRQAGLLQLTRDAITDTLKPLPVSREQPEYLHAAQIRKLLEAAARHDAATFIETREEHVGLRPLGTTPRYTPIVPFTAFLLLTGCRRGEALALTWSDVDLEALDHDGRKVGEIRLRADATKTKHARTIGLEVSPALRTMLAAMKLKAAKDEPFVFGGKTAYTVDVVETARARMISEVDEDGRPTFGAPKFDWQMLRSTCATYLTNAQGIFGSATVFLSARQLGHSVTVAERHYLNVHRGIPREARTLEVAMQIEETMRTIAAPRDGACSLPADLGRRRKV